MTRLEELIYGLATVIVRYHDSQDNIATKDKLVTAFDLTTLKERSYERAVEIIQKSDFVPYLEGKIIACTKGYPARKEFLAFILNEICFLKEQLDRKTPFPPKELQAFQEQLTQLLIDFRQLLNIKKGVTHSVTENSSKGATTKELLGLLNDRYIGGKYCNSGQLLIDEVLSLVHMTTDNSDIKLKNIAANICKEQQNFLELESSKLKNATDESEREAQKLKLEAERLELETQRSELEKQKSSFAIQKSESEAENLELKENNKAQLATIEELTKKLEKATLELEKAQSQAPSRRYPAYSPLFGLAGLHMLQKPGTTPRFFPPLSETLPIEENENSSKQLLIE